MKTLLAQPNSPFPQVVTDPTERNVDSFTLRRNGRLYRFVIRDKVAVEDHYVVMVKAAAYAIRYGTGYPGAEPPRELRDGLIKNSVVHTQ